MKRHETIATYWRIGPEMIRSVRLPMILSFVLGGVAMAQETPPSGEAIYAKHCAECHGDKG